MTTLYIAEKPDIASSIAAYLWPGEYTKLKDKHCYHKGDVTVTWAFGHILMTCMPEAYGEQFKDFKVYPVIPQEWKKEPSPSAREQFLAIKKMLKTTDLVVNGGDPDREGQLLIDEILDYVGYTGKVSRILINAKDDASMKRAFGNIVPDENYRNLYHAGMARERADWLVGMNLSRCYSVNAKKNGIGGVWRIGRVKVPTLSLVVQREKEIEDFRPVDYFVLVGKYAKDGVDFTATFSTKDDAPTDSEGRIIERSYLEKIVSDIQGKKCRITTAERKSGFENAPLPYSLDTLQVEANRRYGMSPSTVLQNVQSLYEKKYVSYPRSDCNYIPTSQHDDARKVLASLADGGMVFARNANPTIKSKAFNDGKVSAHHAIIPTGVIPKGLNDWEKKVYDMIATRYVIQFYPPCRYITIRYAIDCDGYTFTGSGKVITDKGWKAVSKTDDADTSAESANLPDLKVGDILMPPTYDIETRQTQSPKRFTEGTLLAAMTNIWRFVSPDNPNRDKLKECKGIGTPATRDTIISELLADKSGEHTIIPCLKKQGKDLVPTEFGRCLIANLDESLTKPDFTAMMEYNLTAIAEGRMSLSQFMKDMEKLVYDNIRFAESRTFSATENVEKPAGMERTQDAECPICHKQTLRRFRSKQGNLFWVCTDKGCLHPVTGKTAYYDDMRGKPMIKMCPTCQTVLRRVTSKKDGKAYWICDKCNSFINEGGNNKNKQKYNKSSKSK